MENKLVKVEYKDVRVLTTEQLAQAYECEPQQIKQNFNNNKEHFREGKHFFKLTGDALRDLRVENIDLQISPMTRCLYLWTRRGASRHCKMLGTEKAWEMYDSLEDNYFNPRPKELTDDEIIGKALMLQTERLRVANQKIAELAPKAEFFDTVASSDSLLSMGQVAKTLNMGIGRNNLFALLRFKCILNFDNIPYQRFVNAGYFKLVEGTYNINGEPKVSTTTYVSQKGLDYIRKILLKDGYQKKEE